MAQAASPVMLVKAARPRTMLTINAAVMSIGTSLLIGFA
jgi:hypothetical protein